MIYGSTSKTCHAKLGLEYQLNISVFFLKYQFCPTLCFSLAVWAPNSGESGSCILIEILQSTTTKHLEGAC